MGLSLELDTLDIIIHHYRVISTRRVSTRLNNTWKRRTFCIPTQTRVCCEKNKNTKRAAVREASRERRKRDRVFAALAVCMD